MKSTDAPEAQADKEKPRVLPDWTPTDPARVKRAAYFLLRGFLMLLAGSALILLCKFSLEEGFVADTLVFIAACIILLGNGYIIFGSITLADSGDT